MLWAVNTYAKVFRATKELAFDYASVRDTEAQFKALIGTQLGPWPHCFRLIVCKNVFCWPAIHPPCSTEKTLFLVLAISLGYRLVPRNGQHPFGDYCSACVKSRPKIMAPANPWKLSEPFCCSVLRLGVFWLKNLFWLSQELNLQRLPCKLEFLPSCLTFSGYFMFFLLLSNSILTFWDVSETDWAWSQFIRDLFGCAPFYQRGARRS